MLYETEGDRTNEKKAMQILSRVTGHSYERLPKTYRVDIAQIDKTGAITAWIEYKKRTHFINQYPTLLISTTKLTEGVMLSRLTGIPFWLVVGFESPQSEEEPDLYRLKVEASTIQEARSYMGGRKDRGDPADREPVCLIDVAHFKKIN